MTPPQASSTQIARGLDGIVLTETRLSRVDGEAGELIIGGFPVEALAPNAAFEEALYLLWHGRLPSAKELQQLQSEMAQLRQLPQATADVMRQAAAKKMPPMDALRMAADTLSLADSEPEASGREANLRRARGLAARFPSIIGGYQRLRLGQEPMPPRSDLGHAAYFLYALTGEEPDPAKARALETYLNAVIDHGMNASTFTARVIVSTRSDIVSAIVGAIGALKGPLHGGAPGPALDAVFELRQRSQQSGESLETVAEAWARQVIEAGERIMGFGHRVYRVRDPRADVLGAAAERLFEQMQDASLYSDAGLVERVVLRVLEGLKPGRRIRTNVEFYTALVLHGVGLEADIFSSVFAMGRVGGWTAHVLEQMDEDVLIRPRAVYGGEVQADWIPLESRG